MGRVAVLGIAGLSLVLGLALACGQAAPTPTPTPTVVKTFPTLVPNPTSTPVAAPTTAAAATPAAPAAGDAAAGKTVFTAKCDVCHPGGKQGIGLDLTGIGTRQSDAQIAATVRTGKGAMPAFGSQLSDKEMADILAFLKTLK